MYRITSEGWILLVICLLGLYMFVASTIQTYTWIFG